jgi:hypothetical protein
MDVCVCLSGADGRVVERRERHSSDTTAKSAGFKSQAGWASHECCVVFVLCCPERKKEKRGRVGVGDRGKYPGAPPHIRKKKGGKNKPTARYLIDQYGERGKATTKKKKKTRRIVFWRLLLV